MRDGRAARAPGSGAGWGIGFEGRDARERFPVRSPFPPLPSRRLRGGRARFRGVGGLGGEEAGPTHWLLPAPPASIQREPSLRQVCGPDAGAQRSAAVSVR